MDLGLANKVVLVTGGSRGIGLATCIALAQEGARVAFCGRTQRDCDAALAELYLRSPGPHCAITVDVSEPAGADRFVAQALEQLGAIDALVNNVGGSGARHFDQADDADFSAILGRNFWPALRITRLAAPHIAARGGGAVVMVASIWGREAGGGISYNVAKAAEISLAKALSRDLAKQQIRVNSVAPGSTIFPGGSWERRQLADPEGIAAFVKNEIPFGRFGKPEEIARAIVFLCSPAASWIAGACLPVDGGQSRAF